MIEKDRHASAATRHDQAARYHREASRHFGVGKDPNHWAHQALLAHGHTLRAIECGNEAREFYARHGGNVSPKRSQVAADLPAAAFEAVENGTILDDAGRHVLAANYHEEAARCHRRASEHCVRMEYGLAAREAEVAHDHAQRSAFQSQEATKQYFDRNAEFDSAAQDIANWVEREMTG